MHAETGRFDGQRVQLSGLELRHFRNLGVQELEIPLQGVALVGDNAQGKSNFLEAIYYLETFRSFRGAPDEQLVGLGEEVFRVAGQLRGARASPLRRRGVPEARQAKEGDGGRRRARTAG